MFVASWNVNSIHARLPRLLAWLQARRPDVVCLQETKTVDDKFPHEALGEVGYHAVTTGQKSYNGVALLVPTGVEFVQVHRGLKLAATDAEPCPQARLIAAQIAGMHIVNVYVPNGSTLEDPKCAYKQAWLAALRRFLDAHYTPQMPLVVCGDYNVCLHPGDMRHPERWEKTVLYHPSMRAALQEVTDFGLVDLIHKHHPEGGLYTWWDYRHLGFQKNNGVRIDHLMATESLACRTSAAGADREVRKGERPSDHVPAWAEFSWP